MKPVSSISSLLFCLLLFGCEEPFDPKGAFEETLVVYSLLTNKADTQYVRIYSTYDTGGYDPLENSSDTPVRNAVVRMSEGQRTYFFRETMVERHDKSRYTNDIPAYAAFPFRAEPGKTYSLTVETQSNKRVAAAVTVPSHGTINVENRALAQNPWLDGEDLTLRIQLSNAAKGFLVRVYLEYDVFVPGTGWEERANELPTVFSNQDSIGTYDGSFPSLTRRTSPLINFNVPLGSRSYEYVHFPIGNYRTLIKLVRSAYHVDNLRFKHLSVRLVQVDQMFYNYYNIANGFGDQASIRVDQPDVSNIQGGIGLLGAFTETTLLYELPPGIGFNR